ncbi:hypothetical protein CHLNCDRAFT_18988 [Chlorella variabilis]|uniref:Carbamoyl phosphate synthase small chain, chloroplastic n=1 Tax=Chlorella variabilis TaxID=554065 RepID=E1Z4P7_CHLVA|nr:hypothetical protein CHLNCDRAFT_18988 [Chlorella variabilis]EFN59093.1 hypothetical protein CHLNCDRAFT_18988 [Chlorella variabilis]|eukprot:XP_005851195.1 hypothetical protein CHLNCDRAFT_18988 [Chlorella variabilis]
MLPPSFPARRRPGRTILQPGGAGWGRGTPPRSSRARAPPPAGVHAACRLRRRLTCRRLVLEDGSVWHGKAFGYTGTTVGEVVFNTSLTGYQEILTDPSYKGQFVVFTYPHIGNDMESSKAHLGGVIVRDLSIKVSNYRSNITLDEYLKQHKVMGIAGVDTRAITRRLRVDGCLNGVICTDASISDEDLVAQTKAWTIVGKDLIKEVTCSEPYEWQDPTGEEWEFAPEAKAAGGKKLKVVAYDYGIKLNILRRLTSFGCSVTVVPADYPADKVLAMDPDGVFFSNGPGDPSAVPYAVENAKQILGKKPVFGICMGHQVLGQAFGGKTFKLKFGHHGGNHPLRHTPTGRIEISAQNHNFAVDPATLPPEVEISLINLNDGTCAGMVHPGLKAMTVQSHPEASPGPHDSDVAFSQVHAGMHAWVPSCMASQPASCGALLVHVVSTLRSLPPP